MKYNKMIDFYKNMEKLDESLCIKTKYNVKESCFCAYLGSSRLYSLVVGVSDKCENLVLVGRGQSLEDAVLDLEKNLRTKLSVRIEGYRENKLYIYDERGFQLVKAEKVDYVSKSKDGFIKKFLKTKI